MSIAPHSERAAVWPGGPSLCGPHAVSSFATCPQAHAYAHELHLRPIISKPAAAIGTLIHAGLAYYYAEYLTPRPSWYIYSDGAEAIRVLGADRPDYAEIATKVFGDYVERFRGVCTWRPVLVEHQFVVDFDGMPYSCRIDLLVEDNDGLVLVDHKSCGKITPSMGAGYAADWQMLTGLAQCRAAGYDVKRVVINALSREMPNPAFRRFDVPILANAYARLPRDVAYHLANLKRVREQYPDPMDRPRNGAACMGRYGQCEFFDVCQKGTGMEMLHVPAEYQHGRERKGT